MQVVHDIGCVMRMCMHCEFGYCTVFLYVVMITDCLHTDVWLEQFAPYYRQEHWGHPSNFTAYVFPLCRGTLHPVIACLCRNDGWHGRPLLSSRLSGSQSG